VALFANRVKYREGRSAISSRRATEAYPLRYVAKSGTQRRARYGTRILPYLGIGPPGQEILCNAACGSLSGTAIDLLMQYPG